MNVREIFLELLEKCPNQISVQEMELFILHQAHEMCRKGEITFEMFGMIMDEACRY